MFNSVLNNYKSVGVVSGYQSLATNDSLFMVLSNGIVINARPNKFAPDLLRVIMSEPNGNVISTSSSYVEHDLMRRINQLLKQTTFNREV